MRTRVFVYIVEIRATSWKSVQAYCDLVKKKKAGSSSMYFLGVFVVVRFLDSCQGTLCQYVDLKTSDECEAMDSYQLPQIYTLMKWIHGRILQKFLTKNRPDNEIYEAVRDSLFTNRPHLRSAIDRLFPRVSTTPRSSETMVFMHFLND